VKRCYGLTVNVALMLLVTPPDVALITVVPTATAVATPSATVATAGLLELQLELVATSTIPLHVVAFAANAEVLAPETETLALVGEIAIDWMQPTVTVSDCVPVIVGFWVEVAVMVAVPVLTDFTNPPVETVAIELSLMLQVTDALPVLPSLKVPTADICTVLFALPVSMDGEAGATTSELSVGFTKNPRQLTAKASVASAAKAQAMRNLDFSVGIFVAAPWARQLGSSCLPTRLKNCSRDDFTRRTPQYLNPRRGNQFLFALVISSAGHFWTTPDRPPDKLFPDRTRD